MPTIHIRKLGYVRRRIVHFTLLGSVRSRGLLARSLILQILMQKSEGFYPDFMKVVSIHAIVETLSKIAGFMQQKYN